MFAVLRRTLARPASNPQPIFPAEIAVEHGGASFTVELNRTAGARRITLRVSGATGDIRLTCPERTTFGTVERFARDHAGWIAQRVARLPQRTAFIPGAEIPLRGVPHRIVHWSAIRGRTHATTDSAGLPIIAVSGPALHLARRVTEFLQAEARLDLARSVARHTEALGLPARRIGIRDTRSRWGSCSSAGSLSFSWRLILSPPHVLDYLAAHEVAHLKEMNHSPRFWRVTRALCPRTDEAERWLKREGNALHRYG